MPKPKIVLSQKELRKRGSKIRKLLRTISRNTDTGPSVTDIPRKKGLFIAVFDGAKPIHLDFRDWRFKTAVRSVNGAYFEHWAPVNPHKPTEWLLFKAYLNLYKMKGTSIANGFEEFVCLHCDPNEPPDSDHFKYKCTPHLHISASEHPIPKAHITHNLDFRNQTLESVDSLFKFFASALLMIKEEILSRLS